MEWVVGVVKLIAEVGPYPPILTFLGFLVWGFARWASPIARGILEAHVKGMTALEENTARTADSLVELIKLVDLQGQTLKHFGEASLAAHRTTQARILEVMDALEAIAAEAGIKLAALRRRREGEP